MPVTPKQRGKVDFSLVPERQAEMHARLINWGRSCNGGAANSAAPMFRQHQTPGHWAAYGSETTVPVDRVDAVAIGRGVYYLPQPHMVALQWYYVRRTSIRKGMEALTCSAEALARYVIDARTMLINRGV